MTSDFNNRGFVLELKTSYVTLFGLFQKRFEFQFGLMRFDLGFVILAI